MKNIIYGGCNQQPNEKKLRIVWSLEWENVGFDLSHWWHSQTVQWGQASGGVWILDEREEIKKEMLS